MRRWVVVFGVAALCVGSSAALASKEGGGGGAGGSSGASAPSIGSPSAPGVEPGGSHELIPESRLIPPTSAPWWGMTPLQERAWDAWKACERPFMTLGSLDHTGRITYGGLEMELPAFEACMAGKGFRKAR